MPSCPGISRIEGRAARGPVNAVLACAARTDLWRLHPQRRVFIASAGVANQPSYRPASADTKPSHRSIARITDLRVSCSARE